MNIVLLCKRHNHRKVIEILTALRAQKLQVSGLVALERRDAWPSLKEVVRKLYYRRFELAAASPLLLHDTLNSAASPRLQANGATAHVGQSNTNGHTSHNSTTQALPAAQPSSSPANVSYKTVDEYARAHQIPLIAVADLNGPACVAALQKFQTDLLLLGGTPIIRGNVLAVPRLGTLNVHMAWLPGIRGMNVAEWSVYCNAPVAVTVHFVDAGVDTGAVLHRESIEVSDCRSIAALRQYLSAEQHRALARAARLLADKQIQPEPQARANGKQYYLMHEKLKRVVEKKLSMGYHSPATLQAQ